MRCHEAGRRHAQPAKDPRPCNTNNANKKPSDAGRPQPRAEFRSNLYADYAGLRASGQDLGDGNNGVSEKAERMVDNGGGGRGRMRSVCPQRIYLDLFVWTVAMSCRRDRSIARRRCGASLLELLVVISLLALLMQLLLPAVQAARESARRAQCQNRLRQLGLACLVHETSHGHLPTGGWTYLWVGDPDRGYGRQQPGGWPYAILPYMGRDDLRLMGKGLSVAEKRAAAGQLQSMPLPDFACPTRRPADNYPCLWHDDPPRNVDAVPLSVKSDYAANAGFSYIAGLVQPMELSAGDASDFPWGPSARMDGVVYQRSETRIAEISDGASQTYLLGEKYLNRSAYSDPSRDYGDNQTMYVGYDQDNCRWAAWSSSLRPPLQDLPGYDDEVSFGSAHPGGCNFVFCDGSVRSVSFQIDGRIHGRLCQRADGTHVDRGAMEP